jgi:hypothetical protein
VTHEEAQMRPPPVAARARLGVGRSRQVCVEKMRRMTAPTTNMRAFHDLAPTGIPTPHIHLLVFLLHHQTKMAGNAPTGRTMNVIGFGAVGQAWLRTLRAIIAKGVFPASIQRVVYYAPEIKEFKEEGIFTFNPSPMVSRETLTAVLDNVSAGHGEKATERKGRSRRRGRVGRARDHGQAGRRSMRPRMRRWILRREPYHVQELRPGRCRTRAQTRGGYASSSRSHRSAEDRTTNPTEIRD